jgi:hypothetical protein
VATFRLSFRYSRPFPFFSADNRFPYQAGHPLTPPKGIGELTVLMAISPYNKGPLDRRWKVLYQTAVWCIVLWKDFLSHSFASNYRLWEPGAARSNFRDTIKQQVPADRAACLWKTRYTKIRGNMRTDRVACNLSLETRLRRAWIESLQAWNLEESYRKIMWFFSSFLLGRPDS